MVVRKPRTSGPVGVEYSAGEIFWWPEETPPLYALYCDGREVGRSVYFELFNVIGERFGAGDGSTTFNLPDMRGQFVRGFDPDNVRDPQGSIRTVGSAQAATSLPYYNVGGGGNINIHGSLNNRPTNTDGTISTTEAFRFVTASLGGGAGGLAVQLKTRPTNINLLPCIRFTGVGGNERLSALESKVSNMLGVARTVFFDDQIQVTSGTPVSIDTGIVLKDGADYQIVISAMSGTTGSSASTGNGIMPQAIINGAAYGLAGNQNANALLNTIYKFRWQMHSMASNPANNVVGAFPLFGGTTVSTVIYSSSANFDVDGAGIATTYGTQPTTLFRVQTPATDMPTLRLATVAAPTGNMRFMVKVIEQQRAHPTN